jgi:hypothetical protein
VLPFVQDAFRRCGDVIDGLLRHSPRPARSVAAGRFAADRSLRVPL